MTAAPRTRGFAERVTVGPLSLAVTRYGNIGPDVILLHGIGSRGVSWWPVIDDLADRFRLVVPDLRGHGDSDKPARGYRLPDYAVDLDGLIGALGLERPAILGHSLGGMIAVAWAARHGDTALRLLLEDTPLRGDREAANRFSEWITLAGLSLNDATTYYRATYPTWTDADCQRRAESITGTAPAVFTDLRDQMIAEADDDRIGPLATLEPPVLAIHGDPETGSLVWPADLRRLVEIVPNAEAVRIVGGSHSLHRDFREPFLAAAIPFLLGESATGTDRQG